MTKMIKICDICKREVDWLYAFPMLHVKGLNLDKETQSELCVDCTKDLIRIISKEVHNYDPSTENH